MFSYSVNEYDWDGDIFEAGIYLHFNQTRIKVAEDLEEFKHFANEIQRAAGEISENYNI